MWALYTVPVCVTVQLNKQCNNLLYLVSFTLYLTFFNISDPHFCTFDEFMCSNYTCINKDTLCDGKTDCPDGEDEADCPVPGCNEGQFECQTSKECINMTDVCNGRADCSDRSDEGPGCSKQLIQPMQY